jgi:carbon-monoxide dehydrogenase large subunit
MVFSEGRYALRGDTRGIDLLEVAAAARDPANLPDDVEAGGLDTYAYNPSDIVTFPNGCHVAEIEIDPLAKAADAYQQMITSKARTNLSGYS